MTDLRVLLCVHCGTRMIRKAEDAAIPCTECERTIFRVKACPDAALPLAFTVDDVRFLRQTHICPD